MRTLAALVLVLLAACERAPELRDEGLRMDGLGAAKIGMTLKEVETTLGPLVMPKDVDPMSCFYVRSDKHQGVLVMMMDGVLQRIDVRDGDMTTDTGLAIGDPAQKVHDVYGGKVEVLPHKYDYAQGAQYLTVYSEDKRRALRFNTADGKIATFQAGNAEQVQYVEGCG